LFASLAQALIKNGKIVTTRAKAKAVISSIEKMVTLAKRGDIAARQNVLSKLDNRRESVEVLFKEVAKAFSNKKSGFVRIISLPRRVGDNAQMVRMEWTEKVASSEKPVAISKETKDKKTEEVVKKAKKSVKPKTNG
jgi:large subunit ribosomal protein L17